MWHLNIFVDLTLDCNKLLIEREDKMELGETYFTSILIVSVVTIFPAFLMRRSKRVKAKSKACGEKFIDISPFFFLLIYGVGGAFAALGVWVLLNTDEPGAGVGFIGMGLVFVVSAGLLNLLDTSVTWTGEYIRGAKSGVSIKKNTILWKDVASVKCLPNKTFQLEDKFGKRIHWSPYQTGWFDIIADLRRFKPDVDTSDFD